MSLSDGVYKISSTSVNLPLKPTENVTNSDIVAFPDDLTDMFKVRSQSSVMHVTFLDVYGYFVVVESSPYPRRHVHHQ